MADWLSTMTQTFEYYIVDPQTWRDKQRLTGVKSCSITRDLESETLGSASIEVDDAPDECYIRVYMIVVQNGVREKLPLGTFLIQTPSSTFDGKTMDVSIDAYTPLLELKENQPPIGYSILKNSNIMENASRIVRENARAPVVETESTEKLFADFVANTDDTWVTFLTDLIANAKYSFELDEMGRILFAPIQELASLQPVWTYTDDNSSILLPEITMEHDLYGIPNVVEVTYSQSTETYYTRLVNDDPNSPTSTVNRGREIPYRESNPDIGNPSQEQIEQYAEQLLKSKSTLERSVSYTHGYCPVRVGDCVRLNYRRAGLENVKAKVISQTIDCETSCQVSEKAVYTVKLWG